MSSGLGTPEQKPNRLHPEAAMSTPRVEQGIPVALPTAAQRRVSDASAISSTLRYWNRSGALVRKAQARAARLNDAAADDSDDVASVSPPPTTATGRTDLAGVVAVAGAAPGVAAGANPEDSEAAEKDIGVIFRLQNIAEDSHAACQPSYEVFDLFDPDVQALRQSTLFRDFIAPSDFEALLEAINSVLALYRWRSKIALLVVILASLVCTITAITWQVAFGISAQVFVFALAAGSQSFLRRRCVDVLNGLLVTEVNPSLLESRGVFMKVQIADSGCFKRFMELDVCQVPTALTVQVVAATDAAAAARNPLASDAAVRAWATDARLSESSPAGVAVPTDTDGGGSRVVVVFGADDDDNGDDVDGPRHAGDGGEGDGASPQVVVDAPKQAAPLPLLPTARALSLSLSNTGCSPLNDVDDDVSPTPVVDARSSGWSTARPRIGSRQSSRASGLEGSFAELQGGDATAASAERRQRTSRSSSGMRAALGPLNAASEASGGVGSSEQRFPRRQHRSSTGRASDEGP